MAESGVAGGFWGVVVIGGPILLILVFLWVFLRNRAAGSRNVERAERGAAELRDDIESGAPPPRS